MFRPSGLALLMKLTGIVVLLFLLGDGIANGGPAPSFRAVVCGVDSLPTSALGSPSDNVNPCLFDGAVGIGTLTPQAPLHVVGPLRLEGLLDCVGCVSFAALSPDALPPPVDIPTRISDLVADGCPFGQAMGGWTSAGLICVDLPSLNETWSVLGNLNVDPNRQFLGTLDARPLVLKTNGIEALRITPGGRVGVGTSDPIALFHVNGTMAINNPKHADEELHIAADKSSSDTAISLENGDFVFELHVDDQNTFAITTSDEVPYLRLDGATGNVGIGVANPQAKLHINGDLMVSGIKAFAQPDPTDPKMDIVYVSLEGPEAGTYLRGTASLTHGEATVELPDHFPLTTAPEGLTAQLTPVGQWLQLYVVELTPGKLVVREAQGKDGTFNYLIQGVRLGFENHAVLQPRPEQPDATTAGGSGDPSRLDP